MPIFYESREFYVSRVSLDTGIGVTHQSMRDVFAKMAETETSAMKRYYGV
jgi:hypothetical protein